MPMSIERLGIWLRTLRAPFFQAVVIPTVLGSAIAWYRTGVFHWGYFVLALIGAMGVNGGTNLANDYFDHTSGADEMNREFTPFSGGSRTIQEGRVTPRSVLIGSFISFGIAALTGIYLTYARGPGVLYIGLAGVVSGYFYTGAPFRLGYRGWGELLAGLNCGPLVVLGAYYVQTRTIGYEVLFASIPIGLLVAAILYINQFSDYEADKAAGKNHLIVILGPERAIAGYYALLATAYSFVIFGCVFRILPWAAMAALVAVPVAAWAAKAARENHKSLSGKKMTPAMAGTIATHLITGLALSGGFLVAGAMK
jgi:1,4-dihydroxy-2-naphthoate octaprenyltransferase